MAKWYKTDGTVKEVYPKEGKAFSLEELQGMIAGSGPEGMSNTVQYLPLPDGRVMYANDNGRLIGLELNVEASKLWREVFPEEKYELNRGSMTIVGNAVVCSSEEAGDEEEG